MLTWLVGRTGVRLGMRLVTLTMAGSPGSEPVDVDLDGAPAYDETTLGIGRDGRLIALWVARDAAQLLSIQGRMGQATPPPPPR